MTRPNPIAIFSRVEGNEGWSLPHWRAELFDNPDGLGFMSRPVAIAYLTEYPADLGGPLLDYLIVFDDFREMGYVLPLVRQCRARFPRLRGTDRMRDDQ